MEFHDYKEDPTLPTNQIDKKLVKHKNVIFSRIPIAWRITGWYSVFLLLMLFLLGAFTVKFISVWETAESRSNLEHYMTHVAEDSHNYTNLSNGIYSVLYDNTGKIIKGSLPEGFPKTETPYSFHKITQITENTYSFFYYDVIYNAPNFTGIARGIVPMDTIHRRTNSIFMAFLAGSFSFIILATIGGYLLIHHGLKPLRQMTQTAYEIGQSRDLSKRLEGFAGNDEITELGTTFNTMLSSLEKSYARERQFSSDVSHELRTPIAVIQAVSDYGRHYISSMEEAKESFSDIFEQSKTMASMVTELLEIARLDNLKELPTEPISLTMLMKELADEYGVICDAKGLALSISIEPHVFIDGHYILLKRAIGNLIDNAIKFSKNKVSLSLVKKNKKVYIDVIDDGHGIAPNDMDKIWNRLYQSEESRNKGTNSGIGLGLSFAENIIKLHRGTISVESVPDEKTLFQIIL